MKRFQWPLERVLTVAAQRELAMRSEVLTLLEQIMSIRQEVIQRRSSLRGLLLALGELDVSERMAVQEIYMQGYRRAELVIEALGEKARELSEKRRETISELVRFRKRKESLERMREEARQEHGRAEMKREQKQFDESAQITFARELRARRLECSAGVRL